VDLGEWGATLAERIVKAKQEIKVLEASIEECETELKEMLGNATTAHAEEFRISWPIRKYQAQPEKVVPAKPAHLMRQSTVTIKGPK
jgi:predicted phage-related endonuclease